MKIGDVIMTVLTISLLGLILATIILFAVGKDQWGGYAGLAAFLVFVLGGIGSEIIKYRERGEYY